MAVRFSVLGSGSSGNASVLEVDGFGLLIDAGLGPRQTASRLAQVGASWESVHAAILTHTHCDHWNELTFAQFVKREVLLYCHPSHVRRLRSLSDSFCELEAAGLLRTYKADQANVVRDDVVLRPFRVTHDGGPTFGFRIEGEGDLFHPAWTLAYAADLGTWHTKTAQMLVKADLLALEFNHDVSLERASGRPFELIARVLSDEGHLSNDQAGSLLGEILRCSSPQRLKHVVQLHLSRQCNRPHLAQRAAEKALQPRKCAARVHTSDQQLPLTISIRS